MSDSILPPTSSKKFCQTHEATAPRTETYMCTAKQSKEAKVWGKTTLDFEGSKTKTTHNTQQDLRIIDGRCERQPYEYDVHAHTRPAGAKTRKPHKIETSLDKMNRALFLVKKKYVSCRSGVSQLKFPPGLLANMKPKSMWITRPRASSRMLPLWRSFTCPSRILRSP